jgi:hypothetical protein
MRASEFFRPGRRSQETNRHQRTSAPDHLDRTAQRQQEGESWQALVNVYGECETFVGHGFNRAETCAE